MEKQKFTEPSIEYSLFVRYTALLNELNTDHAKRSEGSHECLISWLTDVEIFLSNPSQSASMSRHILWRDSRNLRLLFRHLASRLAGATDNLVAARSLNTFSNTRPYALPVGSYLTSFDFYTPYLPNISSSLSHLKDVPETVGMVVTPAHGVILCTLLDQILVHPTARLLYIDPPGLIATERNYMDANIQRCATGWKAQAGSWSQNGDSCHQSSMNTRINFAIFQGVSTIWRRSDAHSTLERLLHVWHRLVDGGLLIIGDFGLRDDLLNAAIWPPGPEPAIVAFIRAFQSEIQIEMEGDVLVLKKVVVSNAKRSIHDTQTSRHC
jgi:hypothetical protein